MFCVHKVLSRQLVQDEFGVNYSMLLELFLTFPLPGSWSSTGFGLSKTFCERYDDLDDLAKTKNLIKG